MAGVSVSTTAGRGISPYTKQLLGWLGMLSREGCIEVRAMLLKLCEKLNNAVDWLDGFECVNTALKKHRGIS